MTTISVAVSITIYHPQCNCVSRSEAEACDWQIPCRSESFCLFLCLKLIIFLPFLCKCPRSSSDPINPLHFITILPLGSCSFQLQSPLSFKKTNYELIAIRSIWVEFLRVKTSFFSNLRLAFVCFSFSHDMIVLFSFSYLKNSDC